MDEAYVLYEKSYKNDIVAKHVSVIPVLSRNDRGVFVFVKVAEKDELSDEKGPRIKSTFLG